MEIKDIITIINMARGAFKLYDRKYNERPMDDILNFIV